MRENDIELPKATRMTIVAALDYAAKKLRERDDKYFTSRAAEFSEEVVTEPDRVNPHADILAELSPMPPHPVRPDVHRPKKPRNLYLKWIFEARRAWKDSACRSYPHIFANRDGALDIPSADLDPGQFNVWAAQHWKYGMSDAQKDLFRADPGEVDEYNSKFREYSDTMAAYNTSVSDYDEKEQDRLRAVEEASREILSPFTRFCEETRTCGRPDAPRADSDWFYAWCTIYWKYKMNPGTRDPYWAAYRAEITEVARRISSL